jgi:hypothetical protein
MDVREETTNLIAGDKVSGTTVYDRSGENIGEIYDVMIDKVSGRVAYAVMSFGGFLGMGESYHPIPWPLLKYDPSMGGYVVNLTKTQLEGAPSYTAGTDPGWGNRTYDQKVYGYYDAAPYWGL